jgi:hypothetical protein
MKVGASGGGTRRESGVGRGGRRQPCRLVVRLGSMGSYAMECRVREGRGEDMLSTAVPLSLSCVAVAAPVQPMAPESSHVARSSQCQI